MACKIATARASSPNTRARSAAHANRAEVTFDWMAVAIDGESAFAIGQQNSNQEAHQLCSVKLQATVAVVVKKCNKVKTLSF